MSEIQKIRKTIYLSDHLCAKLQAILDYPLTIVSAPVGYGKTTSVKYFMVQDINGWAEQPMILWQTLFCNGAGEFWEDFIAVFAQIAPTFHRAAIQLSLPLNSTEQRKFMHLFHDFCMGQNSEIIFILDNIHLVTCDDVIAFLHYFVRIIPSNFHLVLMGHSQLFKNDAIFHIYDVANYVSQQDLSFTISDIHAYSRLCGVSLSNYDTTYLYNISAGWPALIRMNLVEYTKTKTFMPELGLFRILRGVFYNPLSERTKDLLSVISICESFTLEQAEYLWGQNDANAIIEELINENICIQRVDPNNIYQLSSIFAAYFKCQNQLLPKEELNARLNRLAEWYLKIAEWPSARRIYHRTKNFDALMDAVEKRRFLVPYTTDEQEFISYYTDCPPEIRAKHPKAILTFARQFFALGYRQVGSQICTEFEEIMKNHVGMDEGQQIVLMGTYEVLLSYTQFNDLTKMLHHIYKAKELLEHQQISVVWPDMGINDNFSLLFMYHRSAGEMQKEVETFSKFNSLYSGLIGGRLDGAEHVLQADALFATGEMQKAEIALHKAKLIVHRDNQWDIWVCIAMLQMRIALMNGDWNSIEYLLSEVREASAASKEFRVIPAIDILEIFLYSRLGQPQLIPAYYQDIQKKRFNHNIRPMSMLYSIHAEALLAKGEAAQLLAFSEEYLNTARLYPNLYAELWLFIIFTGAYLVLGQKEKAIEGIQYALSLAAPDKIYTPFVEMFGYVGEIFQLLDGKAYQDEIKEIMRRGKEYVWNIKKITAEQFFLSGYGLTNRELEIARLAAMRLSNKEISEHLNIQESTVKTQLSRAFSKLDIKKRRDLTLFFREK